MSWTFSPSLCGVSAAGPGYQATAQELTLEASHDWGIDDRGQQEDIEVTRLGYDVWGTVDEAHHVNSTVVLPEDSLLFSSVFRSSFASYSGELNVPRSLGPDSLLLNEYVDCRSSGDKLRADL
ncbi:hypothetical protein CHS0354_011527 [Potamilus streckersoni]|uniref:Uncharacterized protein n=1 Tax=Potamilus streckersoni TaxID=2493646 RepID=A0AAE0VX80_9BIVA|nr:hypothetical protein CHS0354_011527 [Potamilus streckersoni]